MSEKYSNFITKLQPFISHSLLLCFTWFKYTLLFPKISNIQYVLKSAINSIKFYLILPNIRVLHVENQMCRVTTNREQKKVIISLKKLFVQYHR